MRIFVLCYVLLWYWSILPEPLRVTSQAPGNLEIAQCQWSSHAACSKICLKDPPKPDNHDDVIKWKHFPRYWPFAWGIHRSPINSPYKGQWRGTLMFSLICARINCWVHSREAGDLRHHHTHYDVIVVISKTIKTQQKCMHNLCNVLPFRIEKLDLHIVLCGPLYHKR